MKKLVKPFILLTAFVAGVSCSSGGGDEGSNQEKGVVNVYTHRHYDVDKELFARFDSLTGIKVNVISANADELIVKLKQEGPTTQCDVLITTDAARINKAKKEGLLQPTQNEELMKTLPSNLVDDEGYWYGIAQRARVIAVKKGLGESLANLSYEDLANPEWKGKVIMRSSENSYNQSLLANLIANHGEEWAANWVEKVVANFAREPKGNDRDQVKNIAAGEGEITFVNSYYLGKMENSPDPATRFAFTNVDVIYPNQQSTGTFVDVSAAAVTKYAKNKENAIALIQFLLSKESQQLIADKNFEYPAIEGMKLKSSLPTLAEFKRDTVDIELTGELNAAAVKAFDKGGWR